MIDIKKTSEFLIFLRKRKGYTQKEVSASLHVSYQAVSRWENGNTLPSLELLPELAKLYDVSADEILNGCFRSRKLSAETLGVSPSHFDRFNEEIRNQYEFPNAVNPSFRGGICFTDRDSYLVSRTLEPGHKQELALEYQYRTEISRDTVSFLLNEMICARARPLFLSMSFLSGSKESSRIEHILLGIRKEADKYRLPLLDIQRSVKESVREGCLLFTTTCIGQGIRKQYEPVQAGDVLLYLPSNGLHHHGFTLIKALLKKEPSLKDRKINGHSFLDEMMKPPESYWEKLHFFIEREEIKAFVHITQFGLFRNLKRILPPGCQAELDLGTVRIPEIFPVLKDRLDYSSYEMLNAFNCGIGMVLAVNEKEADRIQSEIGYGCAQLGVLTEGNETIKIVHDLSWH